MPSEFIQQLWLQLGRLLGASALQGSVDERHMRCAEQEGTRNKRSLRRYFPETMTPEYFVTLFVGPLFHQPDGKQPHESNPVNQ